MRSLVANVVPQITQSQPAEHTRQTFPATFQAGLQVQIHQPFPPLTSLEAEQNASNPINARWGSVLNDPSDQEYDPRYPMGQYTGIY